MKFLLSLLIILSCLHSTIIEFKPDDYQIVLGKNFDDEAFDVIEDYDFNISIIGYTQNFVNTAKPHQSFNNAFDYLNAIQNSHGEQLRLIKLDSQAQIVNDINFKLSAFNRGTNIIKTVDNGYILGGYTHSGQMLISSLDEKGKDHFLKQFGTANFDQLHALVKLDDGSCIAIGTSQTSRSDRDNIFVQGLGHSDVYLVKYEPDGKIIWKKKYGSTGKDIGIDGVATGDGGFILLALSKEKGTSMLTAVKINDTGDTAWLKELPKLGHNKGFKIIKTLQNNYIIAAGFENKDTQENIRLIKINDEGELLWDKSFYNDANERLNDISVDLRGNIIGVGYSQSSSRSDMDALVRYYDSNANMIWERKFGKERQDAFSSVALLHDNSFAIAGFTNSFADKGKQIWVLKLNDDGSLVKKRMKQYSTLYEALHNEFKQTPDVKIYKDLRITHDGLIFKQGSSTLSTVHKSTLDDFMPRLFNVLLPYKQQIKNLHINGYTSTEWNAPKTQAYLNNTRLSNDRAIHILEYSYQLKSIASHRDWISQVLSTDGHSYSNLIYAENEENKIRSRRVEFEITIR